MSTPPVPAEDRTTSAGVVRVLARLGNPFVLGFMLVLGGLLAWVFGMAIASLSTVLIYVVLALFIALGLDPAVSWLQRRGLPRGWSILIVIFAVILLFAGMLALVIPTVVSQVTSFIQDLPRLVTQFQQTDFFHWAQERLGNGLDDQIKAAQGFVTDPQNLLAISGGALQVATGIGSGVSGAVIVLVLTLYFLTSLDSMKKAFLGLVPARNRQGVGDLTDQITQSVGSYVSGMAILAALNAVVSLVLYMVLGLPFPALMAVLAFFITLIPLVGPLIFLVLGTVVGLLGSPLGAIIFGVAYLIYIQVEAYVLTPRVMSRAVSVPGSLVVIGALVGGTLLGLLGALVAIPVTASILLIIKKVVKPRQDAKI